MIKASEYQVGGSHYAADYQHWDWAIDIQMQPMEYASTKYLTRWREKNGLEDIQKSQHYFTKGFESFLEDRYCNMSICNPAVNDGSNVILGADYTAVFLASNGIIGLEAALFRAIAGWSDEASAEYVQKLFASLLACVEQGMDPQGLRYWPGPRDASTVLPVVLAAAPQGKAARPAAPQGSTNGFDPQHISMPTPDDGFGELSWKYRK